MIPNITIKGVIKCFSKHAIRHVIALVSSGKNNIGIEVSMLAIGPNFSLKSIQVQYKTVYD